MIKQKKLSFATDLINRGYKNFSPLDFLEYDHWWNGDIVTNPPYKYAKEFVEKAINIIPNNRKVCMFLKITFLEGKARKQFFKKYPPKVIYISSSRISCAKNGDFEKYPSSAVAYAWYIWEKGYTGDTVVKWIN